MVADHFFVDVPQNETEDSFLKKLKEKYDLDNQYNFRLEGDTDSYFILHFEIFSVTTLLDLMKNISEDFDCVYPERNFIHDPCL
uniref:Uncharacterized protein n=1 Tax=viral metagenome TaxID=1070528 RepID=A0A6C0BCY9_9ZZZZ